MQPEQIHSMRTVTISFQLAMFIALVFLTLKLGNEFYAIEAYIIIMFCLGNTLTDDFIPNIPEKKPKVTPAINWQYPH